MKVKKIDFVEKPNDMDNFHKVAKKQTRNLSRLQKKRDKRRKLNAKKEGGGLGVEMVGGAINSILRDFENEKRRK